MLTYLLLILITIFIILIYKSNNYYLEGFNIKNTTNKPMRTNIPISNPILNLQKEKTNNSLENILNSQNKKTNNYTILREKQVKQVKQPENTQKKIIKLEEEKKGIIKQENIDNQIKLQTPIRLNLKMPNTNITSSNNRTTNINNEQTNNKIKDMVKKTAELSLSALNTNIDTIIALKYANYAIAYFSAIQQIYTKEQIQKATNIDLTIFLNSLLQTQNTVMTNIKNNCMMQNNNKNYLTNIVNNI